MPVQSAPQTNAFNRVVRLAGCVALAATLALPTGCSAPVSNSLELTGSFGDQVITVPMPFLPRTDVDLMVGAAPSGDVTATVDPDGDVAGLAIAPDVKLTAGPAFERLIQVDVRPGDRVVTGQVIARVDSAVAAAALEAARADLTLAEAELGLIEQRTGDVVTGRSDITSKTAELQRTITDLQIQRSELQTQLDAARASIPPPSFGSTSTVPPDITATITRLEGAIAQVDAAITGAQEAIDELSDSLLDLQEAESLLQAFQRMAIAMVDARRAAADVVAARLDMAEVIAPSDGVVVDAAAAGEVRASGAPIVRIRTLSRPRLTTYLNAREVRRVRVGSAARVRIDSVPDAEYTGLVTFISPEFRFVPTTFATSDIHMTRGFEASVEVYGAPDLPPGTPADLTILTE